MCPLNDEDKTDLISVILEDRDLLQTFARTLEESSKQAYNKFSIGKKIRQVFTSFFPSPQKDRAPKGLDRLKNN